MTLYMLHEFQVSSAKKLDIDNSCYDEPNHKVPPDAVQPLMQLKGEVEEQKTFQEVAKFSEQGKMLTCQVRTEEAKRMSQECKSCVRGTIFGLTVFLCEAKGRAGSSRQSNTL